MLRERHVGQLHRGHLIDRQHLAVESGQFLLRRATCRLTSARAAEIAARRLDSAVAALAAAVDGAGDFAERIDDERVDGDVAPAAIAAIGTTTPRFSAKMRLQAAFIGAPPGARRPGRRSGTIDRLQRRLRAALLVVVFLDRCARPRGRSGRLQVVHERLDVLDAAGDDGDPTTTMPRFVDRSGRTAVIRTSVRQRRLEAG